MGPDNPHSSICSCLGSLSDNFLLNVKDLAVLTDSDRTFVKHIVQAKLFSHVTTI